MSDQSPQRHGYLGAEGGAGAIPQIMGLLRRITTETDAFTVRFAELNDLHRTDLNALSVLMDASAEGAAMNAGELSHRLHLSAPATTALLDRLSRAGHVQRRRSTTDRRIVEVEMSESARGMGRSLFEPLGREVGAALDKYDPHERDLIVRALTDVLEATTRAREDMYAASQSAADRPAG